MTPATTRDAEICNCLALRQAARHVTQFYEHCMATSGLRATQYSILARLKRKGPMTINALAADLVMDRTTMGRNILPLERDGLIEVAPSSSDRRSKELHLTAAGIKRFNLARQQWDRAQLDFEKTFGGKRAGELRALLRAVVTSDFANAAR
jgi:DNA-binding MarR family transcriptional regulator